MTDRLTADQEREFREHALTNGSPMSVVLAELDAVRKELAAMANRAEAAEEKLVETLQERTDNAAECLRLSEELAEAKTREAACIADAQRIIRERDMLAARLCWLAPGKKKP